MEEGAVAAPAAPSMMVLCQVVGQARWCQDILSLVCFAMARSRFLLPFRYAASFFLPANRPRNPEATFNSGLLAADALMNVASMSKVSGRLNVFPI